jgi:CRP/FNR family transcriptional regulator
LSAFEKIKVTTTHSRGSKLFSQGQPGSGVYLVCSGRLKLSLCSRDGKNLILRIAQSGEVVGLTSALSDGAHHATAEAMEPCQVNFIPKREFSRFVKAYPDASQNLIKQLNRNYTRACEQVRSFALASSSAEKLARLFVTLLNGRKYDHTSGEIDIRLTHEEIGSMINASRETITRLLRDFKRSGLVTIKGSKITVNDIRRLCAIADEKIVSTDG